MARALVFVALLLGCGPSSPAQPAPATPKPLPGHRPPLGEGGSLVPTGLATGCFAWSAKEPGVACVIGTESDQTGGVWSLSFVSDEGGRYRIAAWGGLGARPPRALSIKDREVVESRLSSGEFRALPGPAQAVDPATSPVVVGALSIRVVRTDEQHVKWPTGEWDVVVDRVEVRCPNRKTWLSVRELRVEGPTHSKVEAMMLDARRVLLFHEVSWAIVGDKGASAVAVLVDAKECRAWTSEV